MADRRDDDTLVAAAQAGDRAALDALLRRHYDRVHAVCRRIAGSSRDADDATQEAMISIVRGISRFDGRSAFSTWIYRIATNAALDELRRRLEGVVERLSIDDALAALPEDFRAAVVLRDVADLDYAEIAAVLGVPVGTVKSRIARGRGQLADVLGTREPGAGRPTGDPTGSAP